MDDSTSDTPLAVAEASVLATRKLSEDLEEQIKAQASRVQHAIAAATVIADESCKLQEALRAKEAQCADLQAALETERRLTAQLRRDLKKEREEIQQLEEVRVNLTSSEAAMEDAVSLIGQVLAWAAEIRDAERAATAMLETEQKARIAAQEAEAKAVHDANRSMARVERLEFEAMQLRTRLESRPTHIPPSSAALLPSSSATSTATKPKHSLKLEKHSKSGGRSRSERHNLAAKLSSKELFETPDTEE